jgi:hypothetical protein
LSQLGRARRWSRAIAVGILTAELLGNAGYSQIYGGGTVFLGLEPDTSGAAIVAQPLRWPDVPFDPYLAPSPIVRAIQAQPGRYLTWAPPAAFYDKGYLYTQDEESWPALENGRGLLFGLSDVLGYSPVQLTRYWSWVRAVNRSPVFYNASVLQRPTPRDMRLLSVRWLIVPSVLDPPVPGNLVTRWRGFSLYEVNGWEPRATIVPEWTVDRETGTALQAVTDRAFDPSREVILQQPPGMSESSVLATGQATYQEITPEDIRITTEASAGGILLVHNVFDPGWTASVDRGPEHQVLAADYFLQGVPVPAGRHVVSLHYREPKIGLGILASGAVWTVLAVALGLALFLERRRSRSYD